MNKKYFRDLVPLVVICLIAAALLAAFNLITKGPIEENARLIAEQTRTNLLTAERFEQLELEEDAGLNSCYEGFDADGNSIGYVIETAVNGYGGEVIVTVGFDTDCVITGINVGGENFKETVGLGALAKEPAFTDQFAGKSIPVKCIKSNETKGDNTIDAIAGATMTSSAVTGGVNAAGQYVMALTGKGGAASPNTASVQGFAGPVAVTLQLDDAGAITEISIGDDFFAETAGYGAKALEPEFQAQFIGKVPPLALEDIDAISGATITSTAVVNAVNLVQAQLSGEVAVAAPTEAPAAVPAASENAKSASAQGFAGPVFVAIDLDDAGAITAITIGDDKFAETAGFGAKAQDDAFKTQFIGKSLPIAFEDIDAIAGATITSKAVVEALNAAGGFAAEPAATVEPAVVEVSAPVAVTGDVFTASAQGFAGPVAVEVTVDNGTITAIKIGDDKFAETAGFGAKALEEGFQAQFVGKTLPIAFEDIDAIAGATITSKAVVEAINAAVPAAPAAAAGEVFTASAQGFAGPVAVEVTVDNGAITAIKIGDDKFAETAGFGAKALEEGFQAQFVGKTLPIAFEDIDAIAGATITSKAVVEAINAAVPAAPAAEEPIVTEVLSGSAVGFSGPVAVEVTLENGKISAIKIGNNLFAETVGYGAKALEEDFQAQFIGKTLPIAFEDIDAIAGATVTSKAVVNAINAAVAK